MDGAAPRYDVVEAAEGVLYRDILRQYSVLMRSATEWSAMPLECRTHELSIQTWRGLSAAYCTKHELQVVVIEAYPFKAYLVLSNVPGKSIIAARTVIDDKEQNPCLLDPRTWQHVMKYPTVSSLLSPDSLAELATDADLIELHMIDVETGNASIHRSIKKAVNQKLADFEDVSAQFVLRSERNVRCGCWGNKHYAPETASVADDHEKPVKHLRGGGGIARAFVSKYASEHRLPWGSLDYASLWHRYRAEKAKAFSQVLADLKEQARLATRARRQQKETGKEWEASAFGALSKRQLKSMQVQQDVMTLKERLEETSEGRHVASEASHQLVPFGVPPKGIVALTSNCKLEEDIRVLRRLARVDASEKRMQHEKELQHIREHMVKPTDLLGDVDFSRLGTANCHVRTMRCGDVVDMRVHDELAQQVAEQVSALSAKGSKVMQFNLRTFMATGS